MSDEVVTEFTKGLKKPNKGFEDQWLTKFAKCLDEIVGKKILEKVMQGSEELSTSLNQQEIILWTKGAMDRLDALVDEKKRIKIMVGCACHFPEPRLLPLRAKYSETGDIDIVQKMLQEMFISDLKKALKLDDELIKNIIVWGWGVAGVKKGNTIIATKLPFELKEYLGSTDPQEKRHHYFHCPRIRGAIKSSRQKISKTYCYCGAGFYKDIWEKILQQPLEVGVLETVLEVHDFCRFAIHLSSK